MKKDLLNVIEKYNSLKYDTCSTFIIDEEKVIRKDDSEVYKITKDFMLTFVEEKEMFYGEYKDKYDICKTVANSYNSKTKTIKVLVRKNILKELFKGMEKEEIVKIMELSNRMSEHFEEIISMEMRVSDRIIRRIAKYFEIPAQLLICIYKY